MGRKVMTWFSAALVSLFNVLTIFRPMDAPRPPQKLEQPRLERRVDTLRDPFLMPEEGPHTALTLPPPHEIPFIYNQAMLEAANQAVFSRARVLNTTAYQAFYAPPLQPSFFPQIPR